MSTDPTWVQACTRETRFWQEDDCTTQDPDHEDLGAAWLRIFGEPIPRPLRLEVFASDGPERYELFPRGRVAVWSYRGGCEIHLIHHESPPVSSQGPST